MSVDALELTDEQLREQTLAWLRENLPAGWIEAVDAGDDATWTGLRRGLDYAAWCKLMGEAGYATPTWPAEYGAGLSLAPAQAKHVNEVLGRYKAPRSFNIIGIGMGGPTLLSWGTEEQRQRLLRPCATVTSGSSTGRRCGPRSRTSRSGGCSSPVRIPTSRSTAD